MLSQREENLKDAVVGLNTQGLHHVENGDFRQATTSFLAALQNTKVLIAQMSKVDVSHQSRLFKNAVDHHFIASVEIPCKAVEDAATLFTVYTRCLVIPNGENFDAVFARNENIIPCILLYNVGLCLQMQSLETGSKALADRSLGAYEIALKILTVETRESTVGADGLLLLLAIFNNVAALESQRFNPIKAFEYSELIRQLLECQEHAGLLGEPMFDFFYIYLFLTPMMRTGAAPAA